MRHGHRPASGTVLNGARVDPQNIIGETNDDADDPALDCATVGEGTDIDPATEPDNFDCTSHTVGGQTGPDPHQDGLAGQRLERDHRLHHHLHHHR